jgi:hypothetical protein
VHEIAANAIVHRRPAGLGSRVSRPRGRPAGGGGRPDR